MRNKLMPVFFGVRWKLAGGFLLVIAAIISLSGVYLLRWTQGYYLQSVSDDLRKESRLIGRLLHDPNTSTDQTSALVYRMAKDLDVRITVIAPDGRVIADSEADASKMENHLNRPEVREALKSGSGTSTRHSATLGMDMHYVATPFGPPDHPKGFVRVAEPLSGLSDMLRVIAQTFLATALVALLLAAFISMKLTEKLTSPLERIESVARRLSEGDLSARVPVQEKPSEESAMLAVTFNSMADRLQQIVSEIEEQRSQMQAIFDRTDNGLILTDLHARIRMVNPKTCRIFEIEPEDTIGKTVIEGTLNHDLAALVDRAIRTGEPAALEINLKPSEEIAVQAYVAPIDETAKHPGVLVVMHDITASRQIDAIRRDFVANVSHELRTPLASIKAMAETILLRWKSDPSAVPEFAERIVVEADRMALLAEDLLDLARIESGRRTLRTETVEIRKLVDEVLERIAPAAKRKSIEITSKVPEAAVIRGDPDALHQILVNLVDNAVKYTGTGGRVVVSAEKSEGATSISVTDTGIGIPQENLSRVFERFYRVDKARSRESGGTGLGLSIVKHLTESMGGKITVTSEIDKGTTFTVTTPAD